MLDDLWARTVSFKRNSSMTMPDQMPSNYYTPNTHHPQQRAIGLCVNETCKPKSISIKLRDRAKAQKYSFVTKNSKDFECEKCHYALFWTKDWEPQNANE